MVGLHARNSAFEESDYILLSAAQIDTLFFMSDLPIDNIARIHFDYPHIRLICRLYDGANFGVGHHPTPGDFASRMLPIIAQLLPWCQDFQIHNEPNIIHGYEGWDCHNKEASLESAADFRSWLVQVLGYLRNGYPQPNYGFPGLAIGNQFDLEWLHICESAVQQCDFLGFHGYWQTTQAEPNNHLSPEWGLRFTKYHDRFPNAPIHITECGDSTHQTEGLPVPDDNRKAQMAVDYYQECYKYSYLKSACFFIESSPDPTWHPFAWRHADGSFKPIVAAVGSMPRPYMS